MTQYETLINGTRLSLSVYAENVVRLRLGNTQAPTYFEKYGIFDGPDGYTGRQLENGVCAGALTVTCEGGLIKLKTGRVARVIDTDQSRRAEKTAFFRERLSDFRPERRQILGDEAVCEESHVDFIRQPAYLTVRTEGDRFYGLGESNVDQIRLNGKTYLQKVIYQRHEIAIPFIMSPAGYGISCNTTLWHGVDVGDEAPDRVCWYLPDGEPDFFLYAGDSLKAVLERFTYVTGRSMVLPKWAYGLMFVDQYNANQFDVMRDAAAFREKKVPCDSFSLEPGWMEKNYDFSTEKKWNTQRFYICDWMRTCPERYEDRRIANQTFVSALHRYGFKLMLWLCCRHDFTANQENRAGNPADFGIEPWAKHLRNFVCDGVNGFKMDPCRVIDSADENRVYANGRPEPEMHSLQVTLYGKEMYEGYSEYTHLRPMHHISGGYTAIQKYSACTTGDSGGRAKTLAWILNCGLSGVSNITCDMDIFAKHTIHYCFFTAWCQLNSWSGFCYPWWSGDENEALFIFYDRLRYHLLPYIYSAAINTHICGTPVDRAMPLEFDEEALSDLFTQYLFGDSYLVGCFSDTIRLPSGEKWINAWSEEVEEGGREVVIRVPENRGGALYIRNGAIVPTQKDKLFTDCKDDEQLTLEIYPAADCDRSYTFYEDDGMTQAYLKGDIAKTEMHLTRKGDTAVLTVGRRLGTFDGMCENRTYAVRAFTLTEPKQILIGGAEVPFRMDGKWACFEIGQAESVTIRF